MTSTAKQYHFTPNELQLQPHEIAAALGFKDGQVTDPFPHMIADVLAVVQSLQHIEGGYCVYDSAQFNLQDDTITINNVVFNTHRIITRVLQKASSIAVFACTVGRGLEDYSKTQMQEGNMPEGYIADITGSLLVEKAMDKLQLYLKNEMEALGQKITNRYSPGYCDWRVSEQQKLFSLLPAGFCNIRLTESSLMSPMKSVSGFIGIGASVKHSDYTCEICNMKSCSFSQYSKNKLKNQPA